MLNEVLIKRQLTKFKIYQH